jgi:hypothetical protein
VPFKLDLLTGLCTNGIYERETSGAVLISRGDKANTDSSFDQS